jgi:hypothetical protein
MPRTSPDVTGPGSREARRPSPAVRTSSIITAMKISPSVIADPVTRFAAAQLPSGPANQCTAP